MFPFAGGIRILSGRTISSLLTAVTDSVWVKGKLHVQLIRTYIKASSAASLADATPGDSEAVVTPKMKSSQVLGVVGGIEMPKRALEIPSPWNA